MPGTPFDIQSICVPYIGHDSLRQPAQVLVPRVQGGGLVIEGTAGNDTLEGGWHHDTFIASAGDDLENIDFAGLQANGLAYT